ncbi:MAG: NUDIX hydrolase [Bacteroidales bacterium]|nr:NUDIX hydrolase [Bacteroidales bacterium]MCB8999868.1 NUDIX hydrolase [Bacteroidales bacterium]
MSYYSRHDRHYVAVDCIIFGFDQEKIQILLHKRKFEPYLGEWSLFGGFLNNDENLDDAAERVLASLTGFRGIYLEQLAVYGRVDRDKERVISVAYFALINTDQYKFLEGGDYNAAWMPLEELPELILDHKEMVNKALRRLRRKAASEPIGFELLPEKFTLPQLQKLYEAIYREDFDKRNFRKKLLSMDFLIKLSEKDKSGSRKGAFLYRFDKKIYDHLISEGLEFGL